MTPDPQCGTAMPMRHSTVLVPPGGWLLVVPRGDLPMREWAQVSAHDTARACEERKQAEIDGMDKLVNETWIDASRVFSKDKSEYERIKGRIDGYQETTVRMYRWRCLPPEVVMAPPTPEPSPAPTATTASRWWPW